MTADSPATHQPRRWTGRVFIGSSLDGFIARPDGDIDWLTDPPSGPEHHGSHSDASALEWDGFFASIDHLVMGRGTYEKVLSFDAWPYPGKPVLVLSRTLESSDERISVCRTLADVRAVLDVAADQVYVDGGQVIQTFLRADLIDEITVAWAPVLIGRGLPLFGELGHDLRLTLQGSHARSDGLVQATYQVYR